MAHRDTETSAQEQSHAFSLRVTQVLGFCFYWAWVYLSFNASSSLNFSFAHRFDMLWVHIASCVAGVAFFSLVIAFSRRSVRWFVQKRALHIAGIAMAAGTACYALPAWEPLPLMVFGAAVTGVATCWIIVFWGSLFSEMSLRGIIMSTAGSFFCAHIIYAAVGARPPVATGLVQIVLPLLAAFLIPDAKAFARYVQAEAPAPAAPAGPEPSSNRLLVPTGQLPWSLAVSLFAIMLVYGGMRIYVGAFDAPAYMEGSLAMLGVALAVCGAFFLWGLLRGNNSYSVGPVFKGAVILLALCLLLGAFYGSSLIGVVAPLVTVVDVVVEILCWVLLADRARTQSTPAFLVFLLGRGAVEAGMMTGQLIGWASYGQLVPFAISGTCLLMVALGFLMKDPDTVLVFEAPTQKERDAVEEITGAPIGERLGQVAEACGLTQREREIFELWATGHGSKYIQETCSISASTVKTHVRHIYEKCGVHSRAEIIDLLERRA